MDHIFAESMNREMDTTSSRAAQHTDAYTEHYLDRRRGKRPRRYLPLIVRWRATASVKKMQASSG
jgi:hypothetical protein